MQKKLIYAYLRNEQDNTYTLFLKVEPSLVEQEIDIELTQSKELLVTDQYGNRLITDILTDEIYYNLANRNTVIIFSDENGELLGKQMIGALK